MCCRALSRPHFPLPGSGGKWFGIPTDPFDDQPLRFKKLARGYVVYSIGPDFTDDGGKEKPADAKDTDHYDITFTVER